jgi:hypothetical protein
MALVNGPSGFDLAMASMKGASDYAKANFQGQSDFYKNQLQNQFDQVKRQSDQFDDNRKYEDQQRQANHDFTMRNPGFNSGTGSFDVKNIFGGDKNTTFTSSNPQPPTATQPKSKGLESSINGFSKIVNSNNNATNSNSSNNQSALLQSEPKQTQSEPSQKIGTSNLLGVDSLANQDNQDNKSKNYFDADYFSR